MKFRRLKTLFVLAVFCLSPSGVASGMGAEDRAAIEQDRPIYSSIDGACTPNATSNGVNVAITGSDNVEKAFNFFKTQGLNDVQSAGIVGNLIAESSVNPASNQSGGGVGRGIAQWTVNERWAVLTDWAGDPNQDNNPNDAIDPLAIETQLQFMWMELNHISPAGNYTTAFNKFKELTSGTPPSGFTPIEISTGVFMGTSAIRQHDVASRKLVAALGEFGGFENPGIPHLDRRILSAQEVLTQYGNGVVSGTNAACGSAASVNCTTTTADASLSQVRRDVVCLAQAELAKWNSGQMGPGGDFKTYSQGRDEEWCADFASWIFNKANYPLSESSRDGNVSAVNQVREIGQNGGRFEYHLKGSDYVPQVGDIVVYKESWSHVNIVISVNASERTMVTIGGNEAGSSRANSSSKVNQATYEFSDGQITGYVSPQG